MDADSVDRMFAAAYDELRQLAARVQFGDPGRTLSPTALVNEAWLKLAASPSLVAASPLHFKRIAARAMRQVLVEAARRRTARKRGGGVVAVTFDEEVVGGPAGAEEVLALDEALSALSRLEPRQAQMVESRFFGGLEVSEIAEVLEVSEATVLRDWRAARAWLNHELRRTR